MSLGGVPTTSCKYVGCARPEDIVYVLDFLSTGLWSNTGSFFISAAAFNHSSKRDITIHCELFYTEPAHYTRVMSLPEYVI